jgi:hypothetical protein
MKKLIAFCILFTIMTSANYGAVQTFSTTVSFTLGDSKIPWYGNGDYINVDAFPESSLAVNSTIEIDVAKQQIRVFGTTSPSILNSLSSYKDEPDCWLQSSNSSDFP